MSAADQSDLLRQWIAGDLDEAATGRFAESLADPALRKQICEDLRFDYALFEALTVERAQRRTTIRRRSRVSRFPRSVVAVTVAAAAAVLVVMLSVGKAWWSPAPAGRVTSVAGATAIMHRGTTTSAGVGAVVSSGDTVTAQPDARIALTLADGSAAVLEGPGTCTVLVTAEGMRCTMPTGTLAVTARHQPPGRHFAITTQQAVVSIIGTRFRLVGDAERTSVSVFEGVVGMRRRSDDATLDVGAWQRAEIAPTRPFRIEPAYDLPISITAGGVYQGAWESDDPDRPAVTVLTSEPVIIEGARLRGCGTMIQAAAHARVTVRNCRIEGVKPQAAGRIQGRLLDALEPASLVIERNDIDGTTGILVHGPSPDELMPVIVRQNRVRNLDGRPSDGRDGWRASGEDSEAGFVLLDGMHGIRGADVSWNEVVNEPGRSLVSHLIVVAGTSGSAEHLIAIHDNLLSGAYPMDPATGRFSGGGICIGFGGGATLAVAPGWVRVADNQIISTVNAAIAVFGGHDIEVTGNRAVSSGCLPDGRHIKAQNTAFVVWDMAGDRLRTPPTFFHNTVHDNLAGWMQWTTGTAATLVDFWSAADRPGDHQAGDGSTGNRDMPYPVTIADERAEWTRWTTKVQAQRAVIGAAIVHAPVEDAAHPQAVPRRAGESP